MGSICYISTAAPSACAGRKRRSISLDGMEPEGAVQPSTINREVDGETLQGEASSNADRDGCSSSTGSPPHPSPHPPLSQPHTPSQVLHAHLLVQTSVDRFNLNNAAMLYLFDGYVFVTLLFPSM